MSMDPFDADHILLWSKFRWQFAILENVGAESLAFCRSQAYCAGERTESVHAE